MLHSHMNGTHHHQKDHFLHQIIHLQPFFPISFLHLTVSVVLLPHYYFSPAHARQMVGAVVTWVGTAFVGRRFDLHRLERWWYLSKVYPQQWGGSKT